jgi:hypothetical protein
LNERVNEREGFRHFAPPPSAPAPSHPRTLAPSHHRWVINKLRALMSWYSKGLEGGSHLRVRVNSSESISQLREIIDEFFAISPRACTYS